MIKRYIIALFWFSEKIKLICWTDFVSTKIEKYFLRPRKSSLNSELLFYFNVVKIAFIYNLQENGFTSYKCSKLNIIANAAVNVLQLFLVNE